jgi:mono/diheme cytochrome c family protein
MSIAALTLSLGAGSVMGAKPKPKPKPAATAKGNAQAGAAVLKKRFPVECKACHKLKGEGSAALGPDLTHVGSKMSAAKIKALMQNPKKFNPKSIMPPVKWPDKQLTDASAYLATLK